MGNKANCMNDDKVLLLTNAVDHTPSGGREMLCKLNYDILNDMYVDNCTVFELEKNSINGFKSIFQAFFGYIDGLTHESIKKALQVIRDKNIDKIFVDGSNFGGFVKIVKNQFPSIQIYTFFHNVESRFFLGAFKQKKSPRSLAILMVNYLAERKSVKYSDKVICINDRDSKQLQNLYCKSATDLYPMSLEDKMPLDFESLPFVTKEEFALFVGGAFYANQAGIFWFIKNVVPHITIKTYIVGRGLEKFRNQLETNDKVKVIGEVDSLAQWYHDAKFVVAPIFDGSGMKTKVAEALMYGKMIVGTPEAFSGYENFTKQAGCVCNNAEEFISVINLSGTMVNSLFDNDLRKIYEENFSFMAAKLRLKDIMVN